MNTLEEDKDAQIKGIVSVGSYLGDISQIDRKVIELFVRSSKLATAIPYKHCALHFLYNNPSLQPLFKMFQNLVGKQDIVRFRSHFGSSIEIEYKIMTFGIPKLPIVPDGELNMDMSFNEQVLDRLRQRDLERDNVLTKEAGTYSNMLQYPAKFDILVGRGQPYQSYPGNQRLNHFVKLYREQYLRATERYMKTCIAAAAVKQLQDTGSRFLERKEMGWVIADEEVCVEKLAKALRRKKSEEV